MDLGEGVSGPKAKTLQNVSKKSPRPGVPKSKKKSRKKSEKYPKTHFQIFYFSELFRDFFGLLDPGPGRLFQDFLETFWLLAPRLPLPGHETSTLLLN